MNHVIGPEWRDQWDVVITSAGKPSFYTEDNRPFREVDIGTGKLKFKQVRYIMSMYSLSLCHSVRVGKQTLASLSYSYCKHDFSTQVLKLERGRVYASGCLKELTKRINWKHPLSFSPDGDDYDDIYSPLTTPNIM